MGSELARTYEVDGQEITLSPGSITRYVLGNGVRDVSDPEMAKAIMTCAARKLNPFAGDVHILPHYDSKSGTTKLSVCPSIDLYQRRAMDHPRYRGMKDGVTVIAGGVVHKKEGCAVYKELGEQLVGGWACVYVDGYEHPVCVEVAFSEYDQGRALWKTKPATMINKVAKSQALRKAFPDEFGGLYEPSEMGMDAPQKAEQLADAAQQEVQAEIVEKKPAEDPRKSLWAEVGQLKEAALSMGTKEGAILSWMAANITDASGSPKPTNEYTAQEVGRLRDFLQQNVADHAQLEAEYETDLADNDIEF